MDLSISEKERTYIQDLINSVETHKTSPKVAAQYLFDLMTKEIYSEITNDNDLLDVNLELQHKDGVCFIYFKDNLLLIKVLNEPFKWENKTITVKYPFRVSEMHNMIFLNPEEVKDLTLNYEKIESNNQKE